MSFFYTVGVREICVEDSLFMAELLTALLAQADNPMVVLAVFITAIFCVSAYHSLLRQMAVKYNRLCLFMVDKDFATMQELKEYGLLTDVGDVISIMEGLV